MKTDVIVVGAGPAGCAAATWLAQQGISVILVDKAKFPRDKVCGGVVSPLAERCLEKLGLGEWVSDGCFPRPNALELFFPAGRSVRIERGRELPDIGTVIPRFDLDYALVRRAISAGAKVLEETRAVTVSVGSSGVCVDCSRRGDSLAVQAKLILAADGSAASLSRAIIPARKRPNGIGLRAVVRSETLGDEDYRIFFMRRFLPGYCWIIPMGDSLFNLGIGLLLSDSGGVRANLLGGFRTFLADPRTQSLLGQFELVEKPRGHPARVLNPLAAELVAERTLLLGDAASLIHPLSGEGIGPALHSGILAAAQARRALEAGRFSKGALEPYAVDIRRSFGRDYRSASILRRLLARPRVATGAAFLGEMEPEFTLLLARAVLAQDASRLLHPATLLRGVTLWPFQVARRSYSRGMH